MPESCRSLWMRLIAATSMAAAVAISAGTEPAELTLTEIANGVFVHAGRHVSISGAGRDDIANIGFIVGERCVAVIDTGGSIAVGTRLREAIAARTDRPVCHVINTHVHFDHVLGNAAFRGNAGHFVGHGNLPADMAASTTLFLQEYRAELGPAPGPDAIVAPDLTVNPVLELDLGNRVLELAAHGTAHSHTDITVLDRRTGTLWLGDLLFMERMPALDGSLLGWIKVLEALRAQPVQRVVPGHGPVTAPWPSASDDELRYLSTLRDAVRQAIAEGAFMEDVVQAAAASEIPRWLLGEDHHPRNVTRAFTELEWE